MLEAIGYQYAYKNQSLMTVLDIDSQNIYINARFDGWRTMNYTDLLSPGRAWLRATAVISVYARGGGSTAQVNFINGNFNYIAMPWLYVASQRKWLAGPTPMLDKRRGRNCAPATSPYPAPVPIIIGALTILK